MEVASNSKDYVKYLELDSKFHKTFFKYCGNNFLKIYYENLSSKFQALRFYVVQSAIDSGEGLRSHKFILDSIKNNDTVKLSFSLKKHLTTWLNKYKSDFKIGLQYPDKFNYSSINISKALLSQ